MLLRYNNLAVPRSLDINWSQDEHDRIGDLRKFILDTDLSSLDDEDNDRTWRQTLDQHIHRLLCAMFFRKLSLRHVLGCPADTALALLALSKDDSFKEGSFVTHLCCIFQYFIRTTAAHELRLVDSNLKHYAALESSSTKKPSAQDTIGVIPEESEDIQK